MIVKLAAIASKPGLDDVDILATNRVLDLTTTPTKNPNVNHLSRETYIKSCGGTQASYASEEKGTGRTAQQI